MLKEREDETWCNFEISFLPSKGFYQTVTVIWLSNVLIYPFLTHSWMKSSFPKENLGGMCLFGNPFWRTTSIIHFEMEMLYLRQRYLNLRLSSVQSLSRVRLFVISWIAARQASLSIINSRSLLKLMPIESVMPSSHLILCRPLLLLPPISPSIRVFSN